MEDVHKTIKQYCFDYKKEQYEQLVYLAKKYCKIKNYVYSKYSGINSVSLIYNHNKLIRDVWTENKFIDNWEIPRRFVRNAIDDSIANIKTNWTQTILKTKNELKRNKKINKEQKHFCFYILKAKPLLGEVLIKNHIKECPNKFDKIKNKKELYRTICRLIRKHKPTISKTKSLSMQFDSEMYSYSNGFINLSCMEKNKRMSLKTNTQDIFDGTIRIKILHDRIVIHRAIKIKTKKNNNPTKEIGIDKNYITVIDTSTENTYGVDFNKLQTKTSDILQDQNKKRAFYYNKIRELNKSDKKEDKSKSNRIKKNNLGFIKYNRKKNRFDEELRKMINQSLNDFITEEKPTEIICENLDFAYNNKNKKRTKRTKRLLNSWTKGYVQERLEYKSKTNKINITKVNAAYTSQTCSKCGGFGERRGNNFYCQNRGKGVHSGHNSGLNVLNRKNDKEITLYTPYREVKTILVRRLSDSLRCEKNHIKDEPSQPRPHESAERIMNNDYLKDNFK